MSDTVITLLEPGPGSRSAEAAQFLAQLKDGHATLREATHELSPEALSWQMAPGVNTIAMLLAHVAISEVHLVQVGVEGAKTSRLKETLGLGPDDDGMPLAPDGLPPPTLAGKDIAYFHSLLDRSLVVAESALQRLDSADFDRRIVRPRPQGGERVLNVRWTVNHLIEHLTAHRGQIGLLLHLRSREG